MLRLVLGPVDLLQVRRPGQGLPLLGQDDAPLLLPPLVLLHVPAAVVLLQPLRLLLDELRRPGLAQQQLPLLAGGLHPRLHLVEVPRAGLDAVVAGVRGWVLRRGLALGLGGVHRQVVHQRRGAGAPEPPGRRAVGGGHGSERAPEVHRRRGAGLAADEGRAPVPPGALAPNGAAGNGGALRLCRREGAGLRGVQVQPGLRKFHRAGLQVPLQVRQGRQDAPPVAPAGDVQRLPQDLIRQLLEHIAGHAVGPELLLVLAQTLADQPPGDEVDGPLFVQRLRLGGGGHGVHLAEVDAPLPAPVLGAWVPRILPKLLLQLAQMLHPALELQLLCLPLRL
mmetsp:Transcript_27628/g.49837  ORF Transcript_27628/g.49837 Transcript_27628/m.49837 type:complete len:337 (-) Transcript_27628:330-1340(-)